MPLLDPDQPMPKDSVATGVRLVAGLEATAGIDARSDIFSAGTRAADPGRGGVLPAEITLAAGGGYIVFSQVRGRIGCQYHSAYGPDGGSCVGGNTDLRSAESISGIVDSERTLFVAGVFLGPQLGPVPPRLDFSSKALGMTFPELRPRVGQSFFIGDGLTGTGSGEQQRFVIPPGATTLYLGFADGAAFQGAPCAYGDNTGNVALRLTQRQ